MSESVLHGIDMDRVPRVLPPSVEVLDAFPLHPVPKRLWQARTELLGELALAEAPASGRQIACILAGAEEGYGGHTVETSPTNALDPFAMALEKVPNGAKLFGVMVTGKGTMKDKHVMPSAEAYDAVSPLLLPGSPFYVIPPNQSELCRRIPEGMHQAAYEPKLASVFRGGTPFESTLEALDVTSLSMEDCRFVGQLRHAGLAADVHYYLTGSANGLSGPSVALRPGMYSDLDIIAVSERGREATEAHFEAVAEATYGSLEKTPKVVSIAGTDDTLEGCIYSNTEAGISIDFYATQTLKDAFVRPEYYGRNYFHQLS